MFGITRHTEVQSKLDDFTEIKTKEGYLSTPWTIFKIRDTANIDTLCH